MATAVDSYNLKRMRSSGGFEWYQKIAKLFVVKLQEGQLDGIFFGFLLKRLKDGMDRPGNNTRICAQVVIFINRQVSFHRVRLSGSSLTVGKDSAVVTVQHFFDDGCHSAIVHLPKQMGLVLPSWLDLLLLYAFVVQTVHQMEYQFPDGEDAKMGSLRMIVVD